MKLLRCIAAAFVGAGLLNSAQAHSTERNPLRYLTTIDDPVIHTPSRRVHAQSSFDLTFHIHGGKQLVKLTLAPNEDVIAEGATINYIGADGEVREVELIERSDHRVFKGQAWLPQGSEWTNVGWARIVVHVDGVDPIFEGAFRVDGDHHHILPRNTYLSKRNALDPRLEDAREDSMVIWRDSDIMPDVYRGELKRGVDTDSCISDDLAFNMMPEHPVYSTLRKEEESLWGSISMGSIFGRQTDGSSLPGNGAGVNLASTIGSTAGCPATRRVALVGIATDCSYTASFNSTASVRANIITQMNSASVLYEETFNITLGIQNLTISDASCPGTTQSGSPWNMACASDLKIADRLNLFSAWRGERQDTNAYWTLLTTCNTGSAVGLAWLGQVCVNTAQKSTSDTVSGANVVAKTDTEWLVIAHEVGHTFGAVHDCVDSTCADGNTVAAQQCCPLSTTTCPAGGRYVMNPSTGAAMTHFSPCSIGNICSAIGLNSVKTSCLTSNRNVPLITGSQCGNGIVEAGEDCDCGGAAACASNPCCDAATCKFKGAAVCDPANEDCCLGTCAFASNGTVCRASTGACDPAETCTGAAAGCPADVSTPDGTKCGSESGLACASGQCTSRTLQCKSLMGVYTTDNSTYACSGDDGCQLACASPEFGATCYTLNQNFRDGTACGGGGTCANGQCNGGSFGGRAKDWVDAHKSLVIGLAAGLGGFLLLSIACCVVSSCRRRRRARRLKEMQGPPGAWAPQRGLVRGAGYAPVPGPGQMPQMPQQSGTAYGAGGQQYDVHAGWDVPRPPAYGAPPPVRYA